MLFSPAPVTVLMRGLMSALTEQQQSDLCFPLSSLVKSPERKLLMILQPRQQTGCEEVRQTKQCHTYSVLFKREIIQLTLLHNLEAKCSYIKAHHHQLHHYKSSWTNFFWLLSFSFLSCYKEAFVPL